MYQMIHPKRRALYLLYSEDIVHVKPIWLTVRNNLYS
nr:MAG TPA: hypothetical protein [Myoviridae sp. ctRUJ25]